MRVRISAVDGYTTEVPRDDPRFTIEPPRERSTKYLDEEWLTRHCSRVYMDLTSLDDLVQLVKDYKDVEVSIRGADGWDLDKIDDVGMLEVQIKHDCYQA